MLLMRIKLLEALCQGLPDLMQWQTAKSFCVCLISVSKVRNEDFVAKMDAALKRKDHWDFTRIYNKSFSTWIMFSFHWSWKVFSLLVIGNIQYRCRKLVILWLNEGLFLRVNAFKILLVDVATLSITHVPCWEIQHFVLEPFNCEVIQADRLLFVSAAVYGLYQSFFCEIIVVEIFALLILVVNWFGLV